MSWVAVATIAVGVYSTMSANANAAASRRQAGSFQDQQMALEYEKLDMAKEQQAKWDEMYGPLEKNLASFYTNMTPEQLSSTGLQKQAEAFTSVKSSLQRNASQRGIESPAVTAIEANLELENAKQKAQIRAEAPLKVAEAQSGFLRGAGNSPVGQTLAQMDSMGNAYGAAANRSSAQANQYNQQAQQGMNLIGQGVMEGARAYARNQTVTNQATPQYNPNTMNDYGY